ncbi:MAG: biotin-dependent carboxyltransferase family protein [Chitinophagaceae bacterium]|nr:biotin-dependent carboxyltransferase family protein [Chitinophagaceae bacterium]
MSILILRPGVLDTVQDFGRFGYSHWGINPGGVMDRSAAGIANLLVGNSKSNAVVEIHFPGPQILIEQTTLISICGADFTAMLDDHELPMWQPLLVRRNTVLHFDKLVSGTRAYIALHGGVDVPHWLGSCSTNLAAASGGFEGRRLEKFDRLLQGENRFYLSGWLKEGDDLRKLAWRASVKALYDDRHSISIVPGPEWDLLTKTAQEELLENNFMIHPSSNRMGYKLKGPILERTNNDELISSGVIFGTIQLLPNGQLVVLMADHQTTGGYPRIGQVIAAHLPKLAQLRPSDCIQFTRTSVAAAEQLYFKQQNDLNVLEHACNTNLKNVVC